MVTSFRAVGLCLALLAVSPVAAQAPAVDKSAEQAARRGQSGNLVGHGGPVKAVAVSNGFFASDVRVLTGSFDYSAILWEMAADTAPRVLVRFADHAGAVNAVAFVHGSPRALTASDDGKVALWDLATGKLVHRFVGHESKIVGLDVSRDGEWAVSSGWDRTARLWNLRTLQPGPVLSDHKGPVNAAVFSGSSEVVFTASYDGDVRAFDRASGMFQRRVHASGQSVNVLARLAAGTTVSPNGLRQAHKKDDLVFGTVNGQSGIVDGRTGDVLRMFPEVDRPILSITDGSAYGSLNKIGVESSPDLVALGSGDGRVRILSARDGRLLHDHKTPFGPVWALAFVRGTVDEPTALYHAGLDDFVTYWPFAPRAAFDHVDTSQYPRRFQLSGKPDSAIAKGEIQFARKCSICHTLTPDSANRAGPTLHNIFGRRIATLPGYPYSPELKTLDIVWTPETISKLFELGPDKFTPGSKMPLQVMSNPAERDDLIAFLQRATQDSNAPVDAKPASPQKTP